MIQKLKLLDNSQQTWASEREHKRVTRFKTSSSKQQWWLGFLALQAIVWFVLWVPRSMLED